MASSQKFSGKGSRNTYKSSRRHRWKYADAEARSIEYANSENRNNFYYDLTDADECKKVPAAAFSKDIVSHQPSSSRISAIEARDPNSPVFDTDVTVGYRCSIVPEDHDETTRQRNKAIANVFYNDLVMSHILSYVTSLPDRVNMEMSCHRLHKLSIKAPWNFKTPGDVLKMCYATYDDHVSIQLGDVEFSQPSNTLKSRIDDREANCRGTAQPYQLMKILNGMGERFAKGVKEVIVGGIDSKQEAYGISSHQLILTSDLVKFLDHKLYNVRKIMFRSVGFDVHAVDLLCSGHCALVDRIEDLSLVDSWLDDEVDPSKFSEIIGKNVRRLYLVCAYIPKMGNAIVRRLTSMGRKMDSIKIAVCIQFGTTSEQLRLWVRQISQFTDDFQVRMLYQRDHQTIPKLLEVSRVFYMLPNITDIRIDVPVSTGNESEHLAFMLDNLFKLEKLESLELAGWRYNWLMDSISRGVVAAPMLKILKLRNIPNETSKRKVSNFIGSLPSTLESLYLEKGPVEDEHIIKLSQVAQHLKTVHFIGLRKLSVTAVTNFLQSMPNIEEFVCTTPFNAHMGTIFCDSYVMPNLKKASFVCNCPNPKYMLDVCSQFFVSVRCEPHNSNERWSFVRFCKRRPNAPPYVDDRDFNRIYKLNRPPSRPKKEKRELTDWVAW